VAEKSINEQKNRRLFLPQKGLTPSYHAENSACAHRLPGKKREEKPVLNAK